jgi:Secretion system C-terminal sorting domain
MLFMKKSLPLIFFLFFTLTLHGQKDTINITGVTAQKDISRDVNNRMVTIYPVPVKDNSFTIKTDRDVSFVKITNIIGQDIFRFQYNDPQQLIKIFLENPKRGMYLVTIIFSDGIRVVKKIMVEQSE